MEDGEDRKLTGGGDCPGLNAVIRAVVRRMKKRIDHGKEFAIVVVAEGATPDETHQVTARAGHIDDFGHAQLGGIVEWLDSRPVWPESC